MFTAILDRGSRVILTGLVASTGIQRSDIYGGAIAISCILTRAIPWSILLSGIGHPVAQSIAFACVCQARSLHGTQCHSSNHDSERNKAMCELRNSRSGGRSMKISGHDRRWLSPTRRSLLSFALLLIFGSAAIRSQSVTASLNIGVSPQAIAVNTVNDRVYVVGADTGSSVTVINAATNAVVSTVTDPNAQGSVAIAVNALTNKLYVANFQSNNVTVINGISYGTTVTDPNAKGPTASAVNPVTNKIYVANYNSNNVTVIDGATNTTTTVTDTHAIQPIAIAVNEVTNKIYVANYGSNNVTVIDGTTNSSTTVTDPNAKTAWAVAVNPVTDTIYVANGNSNNVTVINGATNTVAATVADPKRQSPQRSGHQPCNQQDLRIQCVQRNLRMIDGATNLTITINDRNATGCAAVAVNSLNNQIYVANKNSNNISVIDGATSNTTTFTDSTAMFPWFVAVNPLTDKIYVANKNSNNVTVVNEPPTVPAASRWPRPPAVCCYGELRHKQGICRQRKQ